jgi:RNA polymerase sigma factor (sigma-70 family)
MRRVGGAEHDRNTIPWTSLSSQDQASCERRIEPHVPLDVYQALMEAPPHTEAVTSQQERHELRTVLNDAVESLGDEDRWIWEARVHRRISMRAIGRELAIPKSTVARRLVLIQEKLAAQLADNPTVREHMENRA